LGIELLDGVNLTICHFSSFAVVAGDEVRRGCLLGASSGNWIHLNLDDGDVHAGRGPSTPYPFAGDHPFEDRDLVAGRDDTRDQYDEERFTSSTKRVDSCDDPAS
jgi:hypothetical protein